MRYLQPLGTIRRSFHKVFSVLVDLFMEQFSKRTPQYPARTGNEGAMGRVRAERENSRGSAQEAQAPDPVRLTHYTFQKNIAQPFRRNSQALATLVPANALTSRSKLPTETTHLRICEYRLRPGNLCEPPDADPHAGWCGGWGRKTPGYPIGLIWVIAANGLVLSSLALTNRLQRARRLKTRGHARFRLLGIAASLFHLRPPRPK